MPGEPILTITERDLQDPSSLEDKGRQAWALLQSFGFFYLSGPLVKSLDLAELEALAFDFFALPLELRLECHISKSEVHCGYFGPGDEGSELTGSEFKEGFDGDLGYLDNRDLDQEGWPKAVNFHERFVALRDQFEVIARACARVLSVSLQMPPEYLASRAPSRAGQLRLLHYFESDGSQQGMGEHTDFECFTLMHQTRPGLSVKMPSGELVGVPLHRGALVVIAGDQMETLTNGAIMAARHSVHNVEQERYSFPYFFSLGGDEVISPLPQFVYGGRLYYSPIEVREHIWSKTAECFAYLRRGR